MGLPMVTPPVGVFVPHSSPDPLSSPPPYYFFCNSDPVLLQEYGKEGEGGFCLILSLSFLILLSIFLSLLPLPFASPKKAGEENSFGNYTI